MATVNRVFLVGRLGAAPEGRTTPSGARVCTFSVATDRPGRGQDGVTDWHRVVAWERTAELCEAFLDKGHLVAVEGSVQYSQWKTPEGQHRKSTEVRAGRVHFLSARARGAAAAGRGGGAARSGRPGGARVAASEPGAERPLVAAAAAFSPTGLAPDGFREGGGDDLPF